MADKLHLFTITKYFMMVVGQWKFENLSKFQEQLYKAVSTFTVLYFIVMTQVVLFTTTVTVCPTRIMELICYYIQYTNIIVIITMLLKVKLIEKSVDYVTNFEKNQLPNTTEAIKEIYWKYCKENYKMSRVIFVVYGWAGLFWYTVAIRDTISAVETEECPIIKGVLYQLWYPFDTTKYFIFVLINDWFFFFLVMCFTFYFRIFLISLMLFILSQVNILKHMLMQLEEITRQMEILGNTTNHDLIRQNAKACVMKHQEIINTMHLIEKAIKEIVFCQYFSQSFEVAAYTLQMIMEVSNFKVLRTFFVFSAMLFGVYLYYWYANQVQEESLKLCDIIYCEIDWAKYSNDVKIMLRLMMQRAQKQMSFKGSIIGEISLETFTKLIRLCYSIVTFFYTAYSHKT